MKNGLPWLARALASRRTFGFVLLALLLPIRIRDSSPGGRVAAAELRPLSEHQAARLRGQSGRHRRYRREQPRRTWAVARPRTVFVDLLTRIYEMQAVAVGFDVVFPEPDRTSPGEAVKHFRNIDQGMRELLAHLPSNDDLFAKAIGEGKVVLGQSGTHTINTRAPGQRPETGVATMGADPSPFLMVFPHLLRNLPEFEQAAAGRGLVALVPSVTASSAACRS